MKRLASVFLAMLMISGFFVISVVAVDGTEGYTIRYEDGSYAVVTLGSNGAVRSNADKLKNYTYYEYPRAKVFHLYAECKVYL